MIGLGTYAFFWHHAKEGAHPLDLEQMIERTSALDVGLFQICDYAPLEHMSSTELGRIASVASDLGIELELGTRGVSTRHLRSYLEKAQILGARLVRSMLFTATERPTIAEAEAQLADALVGYEAAGVTIALETYEQVATRDLVSLVETLGHPRLGICLDPANTVARLESPREVIDLTAPYVANIHVKDFAFTRREGWIGFTLEGAPLGTGLLDYDYLVATVRPDERGINQIVEHWLPLQDDVEYTRMLEDAWTAQSLKILNRKPQGAPES
jgi:sugar phosphate isomerase/epimerase